MLSTVHTPNIAFIVKFGWCYDISVVSKKNQCEFIVIQELSYSKLEKYLTLSGTSVRDLESQFAMYVKNELKIIFLFQ